MCRMMWRSSLKRSSSGRANKGLQLTKAARCAPFAFYSWGQSLRAAFAAEARCSTGRSGR